MSSRVETRRFQAMGHNWIHFVQPPHHTRTRLSSPPENKMPKLRLPVPVTVLLMARQRTMWPWWQLFITRKHSPSCSGTVVAFESKQILKPGYHISGSRVETRRFQAPEGQLDSPCTAPPLHAPTAPSVKVTSQMRTELSLEAEYTRRSSAEMATASTGPLCPSITQSHRFLGLSLHSRGMSDWLTWNIRGVMT
jgi:hypothetical protein